MRKKMTTYIGGTEHTQAELMPKDYDKFFSKRLLYLVLAILFLLSIAVL